MHCQLWHESKMEYVCTITNNPATNISGCIWEPEFGFEKVTFESQNFQIIRLEIYEFRINCFNNNIYVRRIKIIKL